MKHSLKNVIQSKSLQQAINKSRWISVKDFSENYCSNLKKCYQRNTKCSFFIKCISSVLSSHNLFLKEKSVKCSSNNFEMYQIQCIPLTQNCYDKCFIPMNSNKVKYWFRTRIKIEFITKMWTVRIIKPELLLK